MKHILAIYLFCLVVLPESKCCSVTSDYISPSASDITCEAEQIVLVKMLGHNVGKQSQDDPFGFGKIQFSILETLKGNLNPGKIIEITGYPTKSTGVVVDTAVPYHASRRQSGGTCQPYDYHENGLFLLFLKDQSPYWAAFAATNEEVSGPDDPWVIWAKEYLIQNDGKPCEPWGSPNSLYTKGLGAFIDGDFDKATLLWEKAFELDPDNLEVQRGLKILEKKKSANVRASNSADEATE